MPTSYSEVYNSFLSKIDDYYIKSQLQLDREFAEDMMLDYLKSATSKFTYSAKDLSKRDDVLQHFNEELTNMEVEILAMLMIAEYLSPKIVRDEFLENRLGSKDYSEFSPANQLKQLRELKKSIVDEVNVLMIEYYYRQGV